MRKIAFMEAGPVSFTTIVGAFSALGWQCLTKDRWVDAGADFRIFGDVPKALGSDRLHSVAQSILDQFVTARSGQLCAHYQTFWPFALEERALSALARVSTIKLDEPRYSKRKHRVQVLPAIASVHALSSLESHSREIASELVLATHSEALDAEPNREILEIIWQNVTATIIRNRHNWHSLYLDTRILEQGARICKLYLTGESLLFSPSVLALHGLLTYEKAVKNRGEMSQLNDIHRILSEIRELRTSETNYWFGALFSMMENRNQFEDMLPQLSEINMGYENFTDSDSRYAILYWLYMYFLIHNIAAGDLESAYEKKDRAEEATKIALTSIGDYSITPTYWKRFRIQALKQLPAEAIRYLDAVFSDYAVSISRLLEERGEKGTARRFRVLIPFRRYDEQTIVEAAHSRRGADSVKRLAVTHGPGLFGLLNVCEPSIRQISGIYNRRLQLDKLCDLIEQEVPAEVLEKPLGLYADALDRLRSSTRTTLGATMSPEKGWGIVDSPTTEDAMPHDDEFARTSDRTAAETLAGILNSTPAQGWTPKMQAYAESLLADRAKAKAFLFRAGITNRQGELTEFYR